MSGEMSMCSMCSNCGKNGQDVRWYLFTGQYTKVQSVVAYCAECTHVIRKPFLSAAFIELTEEEALVMKVQLS